MAALLLTVEFMVLLARARRGALLVAVAGALLWLLPGALPNKPPASRPSSRTGSWLPRWCGPG
ncbi:hypothetical protein ACFV4M_13240 [Kitasatospora indigofera]|uniref:hypothetical protein n=1 Tax=Kitasatospora indigofera TaxID=67307 RepID=UPI0036508A56